MNQGWETIKQALLLSGGSFVLRPKSEPDLELLLREGKARENSSVKTLNGPAGHCHELARAGWKEGKGSIVTGYALSADGGWRQHSWLEAGDIIIEPTEKARKKYWGVRLNDSQAKEWAQRSPYHSWRWWQPVGAIVILLLLLATFYWASQGAPLPFPDPEPLL